MSNIADLKKVIVITGHYGSGKTNFSVNLAMDLRRQGKKVALVDLDTVNPYFRSADFQELAQEHGIHMVVPLYANTNLDIPVLTASVDSVFHSDADHVIIDVGGDDAGAIALGRYAPEIQNCGYDMLYVVNQYRFAALEDDDTVQLLQDIEVVSRLKATAIVNNSNLSYETTVDHVVESMDYAKQIAEHCNLAILCHCADHRLAERMSDPQVYPVTIYVKTPWQ